MVSIGAGRFKDRCLQILDRVAETRTPVTVTKRGRPVATVVPYRAPKAAGSTLAGSILEEHGDPFDTAETWDADPA